MFAIMVKKKTFYFLLSFYFSLLLAGSLCIAGEQVAKVGTPVGTRISGKFLEGVWDPVKYISIDEIQPGMEAYCLTCYRGTQIEKFDLDVISVVRNIEPGRDAILVQGTDERFIKTGPVAGCSGSPVYIDGRLAGAIAFAWFFSKDPLYGVTPIEEMLRVSQGTYTREKERLRTQVSESVQSAAQCGFAFDFSRPIDFAEIERQLSDSRYSKLGSGSSNRYRASSFKQMPCPLIVSGLSAEACEQLGVFVEPFGLMAVSGIGGGVDVKQAEDVQLAPGAVLTVPLVSGDITMTVLGTVTEVADDKVYGFGHSFLGYGSVNLPMATGQVHTVVSSLARSFKLGSTLEIVGTLTTDESTAVFGQIGAKPKMISLTIRVDRYNDTEPRVYNCQVAYNRLLTPGLLRAAMYGAAFQLGDFPPDHMIEYKVAIGMEDGETISFNNVSTELGVAEVASESFGSIALLMNNPFKQIDIKSIDFDISIAPKNIVSHIWSVDLSDLKVKAGQEIKIGVVVESYLAEKKEYQLRLKIPDQLNPGKYTLTVCGSYEYERFLRKVVPYRFIAQNISSLIKALNDALGIKRDKLYCLLALPPGGVTLEKAELPDLPATKALVLQNAKRVITTQPYQHWLETSVRTNTVIADKKVMRITVEK